MKSSSIKTLSIAMLAFLFSFSGFAQEEGGSEKKNFISVTFAYGIVPEGANEDNLNERGHLVPSLGADYLRRIAPKWEVGIMVDYELARYVIPRKEQLIRDRAFIATVVGAYNILPAWSVFAGGGMEFEKHKNLGVLRVGTEYSFPLKNRWVIPVGVFGDFKEGYQNFSFSVGIGRSF